MREKDAFHLKQPTLNRGLSYSYTPTGNITGIVTIDGKDFDIASEAEEYLESINMSPVQTIKISLTTKHPQAPCHKAINDIEVSIINLIEEWNSLPDQLRTSKELSKLGEVIRTINK